MGAPTSLGPTSAVEAEILWKDGRSAAGAGKNQDCVNLLQRFVDRYPGAPGYHEARRILGSCYLELGQAAKAVGPLKDFVEASRDPKEAALGKLALGRAYLGLGKFNEAFLLSRELETKSLAKESVLRGRGLLIKALASIGQGQDERALRAIEASRRLLAGQDSSAVAGEALLDELKVRNSLCSRYPRPGGNHGGISGGKMPKGPESPKIMDEAQARDQLRKRGLCLNEVLLTYRDTLTDTSETAIKVATLEMLSAYRDFTRACTDPPAPLPLKPKERTSSQTSAYREELVKVLRKDCAETFETATRLLQEDRAPKGPVKPKPPLYPVVSEQLRNFSATLSKLSRERLVPGDDNP